MFKTALVFGGSWALGDYAGDKLATAANVKTSGIRTGVKIGAGVIAFWLLSSVLR